MMKSEDTGLDRVIITFQINIDSSVFVLIDSQIKNQLLTLQLTLIF